MVDAVGREGEDEFRQCPGSPRHAEHGQHQVPQDQGSSQLVARSEMEWTEDWCNVY